MKAIFDKNNDLVGWLEEESYNVFDSKMVWIGFVKDSYFFDTKASWLGGFVSQNFVDKQGKPVAWIQNAKIQGSSALAVPMLPSIPLRPIKPIQPIRPIRPLRQITPLGGWSMMSWPQYINHGNK